MLLSFLLISNASLSDSSTVGAEPFTLSFCTDYDIHGFEYVLPDGVKSKDSQKVVKFKRYPTDMIIDLEHLDTNTALQHLNVNVYTIYYDKPNDEDVSLVMLDKYKERFMYVKISSCKDDMTSGHKYEFSWTNDFSKRDSNKKDVMCKGLKATFLNGVKMFIVGDSNLGLMRSLMNLEFLSINCELKTKITDSMIDLYQEIQKEFNDMDVNRITRKFDHFFTNMKDALVMKYTFFISENLDLTYLNSYNMKCDEQDLLSSKTSLFSNTINNLVSSVEDIILEFDLKNSKKNIVQRLSEILTNLKKIKIRYLEVFELNFNIQEEILTKSITKEEKIKQCIEVLKLNKAD